MGVLRHGFRSTRPEAPGDPQHWVAQGCRGHADNALTKAWACLTTWSRGLTLWRVGRDDEDDDDDDDHEDD